MPTSPSGASPTSPSPLTSPALTHLNDAGPPLPGLPRKMIGGLRDSKEDATQFKATCASLGALGMPETDRTSVWGVVAAVLTLGNVKFDRDGRRSEVSSSGVVGSRVVSNDVLRKAAGLLGVDADELKSALTFRKVFDPVRRGGEAAQKDGGIMVPLTVEQAAFSRDALAKSLYGKLFAWIVKRINGHIGCTAAVKGKRSVIGVLDIYGFEIMQKNGFEQLMINYCNEKLQQLFIELTLKSEQEEYAKEGIEWTEIKYFNNAPICELIESKRTGILALLDEECTLNDHNDTTFIAKLNSQVSSHKHYDSREKNPRTSKLPDDVFVVKHYAGDVTYSIDGFVERNKDLLYRDLINLAFNSDKPIVREMFGNEGKKIAGSEEEIVLRRPETLGIQFRPNSIKKPSKFDTELVLHQVRYLGLQESIRVRRAGFCHRSRHAKFLDRFKMLSKDTWPMWKGGDKGVVDGCRKVLEHAGVPEEEWRIGKTKVFIKNPATKRKYFLQLVKASMLFQRITRGRNARRYVRSIRTKIPKFAAPIIQRAYRRYRYRFHLVLLSSLIRKAGDRWRDMKWPKPPPGRAMKSFTELFKPVYERLLAKKYRDCLGEERKEYMRWKVMAYDLMRSKESYADSTTFGFVADRVGLTSGELASKWKAISREPILSAVPCEKHHRHTPNKHAPRYLVLTPSHLYLLNPKNLGEKDILPISQVADVSLSPYSDGLIVIRLFSGDGSGKGDLLVRCETKGWEVEFVSRLAMVGKGGGKVTRVDVVAR
ncbi:Unconventional myosin-Ia [Irineochytrium annulatum]|nr:Unconventional myosin-Ia [Irineochytrium annulatum]